MVFVMPRRNKKETIRHTAATIGDKVTAEKYYLLVPVDWHTVPGVARLRSRIAVLESVHELEAIPAPSSSAIAAVVDDAV
jgi:hypothetical protein